jgi:hypothetical protein
VPAVRQSFCAHEECAALTAGEFIRIDPRKRPTVGGVWRFSAATPRASTATRPRTCTNSTVSRVQSPRARSGRPNTSLGRGQDGPKRFGDRGRPSWDHDLASSRVPPSDGEAIAPGTCSSRKSCGLRLVRRPIRKSARRSWRGALPPEGLAGGGCWVEALPTSP